MGRQKSTKVPCPRCSAPVEPDEPCEACERRREEIAAAEQRVEFFDRQLNVLAVVKRQTDRGWRVSVEYTPKKQAMQVGCVRDFAIEAAATLHFHGLVDRTLSDRGWRVVEPLWDPRLQAGERIALQ